MELISNEIWKEPKGFKRYLCSNLGQIIAKNKHGGKNPGYVKPALTDGYLKSVFVNDLGKYCNIRVHRLILHTFNPNDNWNQLEVNHINGIKTDNRVENLEWCTRQENIKHSIENKLQIPFKGEEVGNSILKEFQVLEIRKKFIPRVYTRKMLSKEYKVSEATIKDVLYKRTWNHI